MNTCIDALVHLLQFSDSMLPVGAFSFSNGLETAAAEGIVTDARSLEAYIADIVHQTAFTDGIAALHAHRARMSRDYGALLYADRRSTMCKLNGELRSMSERMGRKLMELALSMFDDAMIALWRDDLAAGHAQGNYAAVQGAVFASCGLSERELFCSQVYGAAGMVSGAALRCVRVSHFDTQRIMYGMGAVAERLFERVRDCSYDDMNAFVPQIDILASMHEKGASRMFMN